MDLGCLLRGAITLMIVRARVAYPPVSGDNGHMMNRGNPRPSKICRDSPTYSSTMLLLPSPGILSRRPLPLPSLHQNTTATADPPSARRCLVKSRGLNETPSSVVATSELAVSTERLDLSSIYLVNADLIPPQVYPPSYEQALRQAQVSVNRALADGVKLLEVELPTSGLESVSGACVYRASRARAILRWCSPSPCHGCGTTSPVPCFYLLFCSSSEIHSNPIAIIRSWGGNVARTAGSRTRVAVQSKGNCITYVIYLSLFNTHNDRGIKMVYTQVYTVYNV